MRGHEKNMPFLLRARWGEAPDLPARLPALQALAGKALLASQQEHAFALHVCRMPSTRDAPLCPPQRHFEEAFHSFRHLVLEDRNWRRHDRACVGHDASSRTVLAD